jgi:hypothetical protein
VPSQIYEASVYGQVPSDYWYTTFQGNDQLPDMFIGRLSAQTSGQAADIVSKLMAYEQTPPAAAWANNVLVVADDVDTTFATISDQLAAEVRLGTASPKCMLPTAGQPPASITSQISAGACWSTASGTASSSLGQWTGGDIYNQGNVDALSNAGKCPWSPWATAWNLFTANDNAPAWRNLATRPQQGAVARGAHQRGLPLQPPAADALVLQRDF